MAEICPVSKWPSFSQCHAFFSPIAPLHTSAIPPPLAPEANSVSFCFFSPWVSHMRPSNGSSISPLVNPPLAADHGQGGSSGRWGGRCKARGPTLSWPCFHQPPLSSWRGPVTRQEPSRSQNKGSVQPANALLASACVSDHACCAC